jgi:hypothetical protein
MRTWGRRTRPRAAAATGLSLFSAKKIKSEIKNMKSAGPPRWLLLLMLLLACTGVNAETTSEVVDEAPELCPSGGERTEAGECPASAHGAPADGKDDGEEAPAEGEEPAAAAAGWLVPTLVGLCAHSAEGLALFFALWGLGPPVQPADLRESAGFLLSWRIGSFDSGGPRRAPLAALLAPLHERSPALSAAAFLLGLLAYGCARRLLLGPGLGWWFGLETFLGDVLFGTTATLLVAIRLEKMLSTAAALEVPPLVRRLGEGRTNGLTVGTSTTGGRPAPFVIFLRVLLVLLVATAAFFALWACLGAAQAWGATPRLRQSPWPGMRPTLHRLVSAGASYSAVLAFRDSAQVQRALAAAATPGRVACVISGAGLGLQVVASLAHCIVLQAEGDIPAFLTMLITLAVSTVTLLTYVPLTFELDGAGGPPPTDDPKWLLIQGHSTWFLATSLFVLPVPITLLLYRGTGWLEMVTVFGDCCRLCAVIAVVADCGRLRQSFSSGFTLETSPQGAKRPSPSVMAALYFWVWSEAASSIFPCLCVLGAICHSFITRFSAECFFSLDAFAELFNGEPATTTPSEATCRRDL